ncbi:MAG: hypothetical protein IT372_06245 [Polyangiaceae bacterium]|nr:hypothetical protein [Polyangiaceae bacterium]
MPFPSASEPIFEVAARYNRAIWPMQALAYALGLASLALAARPTRRSSAMISWALGLLWIFTGARHGLAFFRTVSRTGAPEGAVFIVEGAMMFLAGVVWTRLSFRLAPGPRGALGLAFAVYALVLYPVVGYLAGHAYPRAFLFGVAPGPTAIFTFGMLLMTDRPVPIWLLPIPFVWSLFSLPIAIALRAPEELALPIAGVTATALLLARDLTSRRPAGPPGARA